MALLENETGINGQTWEEFREQVDREQAQIRRPDTITIKKEPHPQHRKNK